MRGLASALVTLLMLFRPGILGSATIVVPRDHPTIKAAVAASSDGDVVEVEDGVFLEENIILEKNIVVRSRNLHGAIIYASERTYHPIFSVRARVRIQGFVLRNAFCGIEQRESLDVEWEGIDLVFLGIQHVAIFINDVASTVGFARLSSILIDKCESAIATNDARGIDLKNCLISNCEFAFSGFNHLLFKVNDTLLWNCKNVSDEDESLPDVYSRISLGNDVLVLSGDATRRMDDKPVNQLLPWIHIRWGRPGNGIRRSFEPGGGFALNVLGDIYAALGDLERAAICYQDALAYGEDATSRPLICDAQVRRARLLAREGSIEQALGFYRRAVKTVEEIGSQLPQSIHRLGFSEDKMMIYEEVVSFLIDQHKKVAQRGYDREAFALVEESKARGFLRGMRLLSGDLGPGSTAEAEAKAISNEISRIQGIVQGEDLRESEQNRRINELENLESSYRKLMIASRQNGDRPKLPSDYWSATVRVPTASLSEDTALLEYLLGEKRSFAFLATRNNLKVVSLPPARTLAFLVSDYIELLTLNPRSDDDFRGDKAGRKLFNLLIGCFGALDRKLTKLIIVPDQALFYLPFEALIRDLLPWPYVEKQDSPLHRRYLVEDYEITYAPSASFQMSFRYRQDVKEVGKDLLAVACSEGYSLKDFPAGVRRDYPPLVHVRKEVQTIAELFPEARRTILVDEPVRESVFKALRLSDFRIIHLATHGYFDDNSWWRSALLLGRPNGSAGDWLLRPLDVPQLRLNTDLTILSACQTAKGDLQRGEGILGFTLAFLAAGSASVISSLWNVDDDSTVQFMRSLYRRLIEGDSKAAALRISKLKIIRSNNRHPFYWAAFVLMGDSGSRLIP